MFDLLWFLLGGFVLGFATSHLWEWLFYRKQRLAWKNREVTHLENQITTLQNQLAQGAVGRADAHDSMRDMRDSSTTPSTMSAGGSSVQPDGARIDSVQIDSTRAGSTQTDNFQSRAARLEGEQAIAVPQARRTEGNSRTATPTAMPTSVGWNRSDPPEAAARGQAASAESVNEEYRGTRVEPAKYQDDATATPQDLASLGGSTVREEIVAFDEQDFFENGVREENSIREENGIHAPTKPQSTENMEADISSRNSSRVSSLAYERAEVEQSHIEEIISNGMSAQSTTGSHIESAIQRQTEFEPSYTHADDYANGYSCADDDYSDNESPDAEVSTEAPEWRDTIEATRIAQQNASDDQSQHEGFIYGAANQSADDAVDEDNSYAAFGVAPPKDMQTSDESIHNQMQAEPQGQTDPVDHSANNIDSTRESDSALARYYEQYGSPASDHAEPRQQQSDVIPVSDIKSVNREQVVDTDFERNDLETDEASGIDEAVDVDFYADTERDIPTVSKLMQRKLPPADHSSDPPWEVDTAGNERRFDSAVALADFPPKNLQESVHRNGAVKHNLFNKKVTGEKGFNKIESGKAGSSKTNHRVQKSIIRKDEIEYPDRLSKVKGIGPKFQERLYASGIYTWDQLSKSKPEVITAATQPRSNEDVTEWIRQAKTLAKENGRVGATYSGPMPSNLSDIDGLTPSHMWRLYHQGIASFAQLASTKESTLTAIFEDASGSNKLDFGLWSKEAKKRAKAR